MKILQDNFIFNSSRGLDIGPLSLLSARPTGRSEGRRGGLFICIYGGGAKPPLNLITYTNNVHDSEEIF